jgi:pyruvate formate-lyase/glycerol dehydratase family glycyl radical enzyme
MKGGFMLQKILWSPTNLFAGMLLRLMAANVNYRASIRRYLLSGEGWLNFIVGVSTQNGSVEQAISFQNGHAKVLPSIPADVSCRLIFIDDATLRQMPSLPPSAVLNLVLKNRLIVEGNMVYMQIFNFLISAMLKNKQIKTMLRDQEQQREALAGEPAQAGTKHVQRTEQRLKDFQIDPGVKFLADPYLSAFSLNDFPRLKTSLNKHFTIKPEICAERPLLLTRWFKENGFETQTDGTPWVQELRQGYAFKYLMENRKPIIADNDLIAGTTTTRDIGVVIYPDASGTLIWSELLTASYRQFFPYNISPDTVRTLNHDVFPFWINRNMREWVREKYGNPLCQRLDERFAVYFLWKTTALSHTICDFPKLFRLGTKGIIREIENELIKHDADNQQKTDTLKAMILCLEGLSAYARNLSRQAAEDAEKEKDPVRKTELEGLANICGKVPENPCTTLDEAVNALWIGWIGVHMENTNAGFSLGRLDQWLQPYFAADLEKIATQEEREAYIKHAVELIGCFYMRCTDHLPLIPDIGNYLFGGSSSDQAITLGGITPDGNDAVNDMTYIFLKVTEMLSIRDPNINARYNREKNSEAYLKRLCEVNLLTTATPSIHNDVAVMTSLAEFKYPAEDLRDWSATGCVEPTLSGKHMGHTNCMMMNMVAALEMAMYNGFHPLMRWGVGAKTGNEFASFEEFFSAFTTQFKFLIDQSVAYNNMLGEAHSVLRPTPFISSLISDAIIIGKDVTKGGARHNSSGSACIGLADITDSLMAVKKLVFEEKKVSFEQLKKAVAGNFESDPALHALVRRKVPLFGSGSADALAIANRITRFAHDCYGSHRNFRGGPYTAGFWTMSNHVAFGGLTGALPSGRLAGKAFTPGLTPEAHASKSLLDNIRDVSGLEPRNMNNNIAFNVKVVPSPQDSHREVVDHIYAYAKTFCDLGGMQMQFNVVSSATLRDAMLHPENYQNLLVRISGYNAYFVTLNREMQIELIERAEYSI